MNLNVKIDGEEEQPLQYVNRFAINIPSGAAAFNLNIVNSGLGNQSYILNPVNPVGQNIVAYQPQMALQSYIALPAEGEGNIIHSLPVGVPVVSGLPVPTGLLPNNFVNTSIIIGNDDCNSASIIKSAANSLNPENEIKINYIEKPVEELGGGKTNGIETQTTGVNCSSQTDAETIVKKPCPLEMSIKAANIDIEFEKCEPQGSILVSKCPTIVENVSMEPELKDNVMKVPLGMSSSAVQTEETNEFKKIKTEITWENNNKEETNDNGFQESLICEVEEANDDEDDVEEEEEVEEESDRETETNCKDIKSEVDSIRDSSSEESDSLPLSVALKLDKGSHRKRSNKESSNEKPIEDGKWKKKRKKQLEEDEEEADWSESDDDVLNLKRIKNEFNYKCYYEPNSTKSATSLVLKIDDRYKKFVRVRSCCSKRECGKKISVQDQKTAHKNFYDLESNSKRDGYLMNCIEHVQKVRHVDNAKEKTNIQLEIENESNGNQKLSDEIQKAIKESLKDCGANEEGSGGEGENNEENREKGEKNTWNFYIVIDRCRKKVCLQFLLKLFQISKSRIKQLQKKMLSGTPFGEETGRNCGKIGEVWEVAKSHLDGLNMVECAECNANPRHRFLSEGSTKEDLFNSFKQFYFSKLGREPNVKYASYKRFLDKETSISIRRKNRREGICKECEEMKKEKKKKEKKFKKKEKQKNERAESEEERDGEGDEEGEDNSSDDEPLSKRRKLKLKIPLKGAGGGGGSSGGGGRRSGKRKKKKDEKGGGGGGGGGSGGSGSGSGSGSRGRDVWSLMLLHLETMPFKECKSCILKKKHRFLDSSFTTQGLFEDYRKYFLKETNSELGLGFTMYEKYFNKNCNYTILDVDADGPTCPRCAIDSTKS